MFKTLLIIGSSGFIGKSIIDYLKKNTSLSKKFNKLILLSKSKKNKIPKLLERKYKVIQILADIKKIKKIPISDFIIYSAISKNIDQDPQCIKNFCKLIKKYKNRCSVLYISSGAVYGKNTDKIKDKENKKITIDSINKLMGYKKEYAKEKIFIENKFIELGKKNYDVSIARCYTFIGKNILKYNFAISSLINDSVKKKNITLNTSMNVYRSYMHSDDMVKWLIQILKNSSNECPIYNLGSDRTINLRTLTKNIAVKVRKKPLYL